MIRQTRLSAKTADRAKGRGWLVALCLCLSLLGAVFYAQNPLTQRAQAYAEQVATASAATYLSLRAVNAFLSTAQEIEVGGSMVVSGSAQPLKVLEPVDDTIERIAGIVFSVMVVTGVLAVAMGPVGGVGWGLVALAAAVWLLPGRRVHGLTRRLGVYGVFLGFALPAAFLISSVLADRMTQTVWDRHTLVVAQMTSGLGASDITAPQDASWWQGLQDRLGEVERYSELASAIYDNADALIASYIALLAVFIFKIFLLPLMVVGGFFVVARWLAETGPA